MLQNFFSRGLIYSFIGLICVEEVYNKCISNILMTGAVINSPWAAVFMQLSSFSMVGVGASYLLFGICCLHRLRDRMEEKNRENWKKYKEDLQQWKSQEEEKRLVADGFSK